MGSALSALPGYRYRENDENENSSNAEQRYHFNENAETGIFTPNYIMGGQKFETTDPQKFLFGSISDLNYLGPYGAAGSESANLPRLNLRGNNSHPGYARPVNVLINVRKHSVRLVRAPSLEETKEEAEKFHWFHVEFTVDCSVPCLARIHYCVKETPKGQLIPVAECSTKSDQLEFAAGMDQQFCMLNHRICPSKLKKSETEEEKWSWEDIEVVIQLRTKSEPTEQIFFTYCVFEKNSQDNWSLKAVKQRVRIGKFAFSLQEIYGIEKKTKGEELESECVICMDDPRDTLILPCRHLAVCAECAEKIRYQQSSCPICRKPFKALLKLHIPNMTKPLSEVLNSLPDRKAKKVPSTPSSSKSPNSPRSPSSRTTEEPKAESKDACEEDTPVEKTAEENKKDETEALEEEQSGDDIFPAEDPKSKTHCTSSFNKTKQSESVNAKVSQDSGIASISRRDSELSIADEGTALKTSKASDDSGGSADSTKFLLHDSAVHV